MKLTKLQIYEISAGRILGGVLVDGKAVGFSLPEVKGGKSFHPRIPKEVKKAIENLVAVEVKSQFSLSF